MDNTYEKLCRSCLVGKKYYILDPSETFCPYTLCRRENYCPFYIPTDKSENKSCTGNDENRKPENPKNVKKTFPSIDTDVKK